ncbi:hypothetical protein TKK_0016885 [Trichogramma kaykai]|uniref:MYND-type domain-containing protein n=1 Tax=Trichogramma kaykai TaxID=54128 RepID=A0ABD2W4D3_9HYME
MFNSQIHTLNRSLINLRIEGCENKDNSDGLSLEKELVHTTINQYYFFLEHNPIQPIKKCAQESMNLSEQGNVMYISKNHNANQHQQIWNYYTRSVAAAPNDSQELALAYSNRSALLYHLREFDECIKDCDKGFKLNPPDPLKAELLLRKVECLIAMERNTAKNVCQNALNLCKGYTLSHEIERKCINKLQYFLDNNLQIPYKKKKTENHKTKPAITFERSQEAPCASSALAIKYSSKWGRHIVAARRIDPGEVLVLEPSYFTSVSMWGNYMFCSHCTKQTWASVPCKSCVFNVYCSDKCKSEAWKKYHQYECNVLAYLYNLNFYNYPFLSQCEPENSHMLVRSLAATIKLMLIAINEVGGIDNIRQELIDIEKNKDPRTKGFFNGVFDSQKCRSIYSLTTILDNVADETLGIFTVLVSIAIHLLATKSPFFGKKIKTTPKLIMNNPDVKFIGGLLLKTTLLLPNNNLKVKIQYQYFVHRESTILGQKFGSALYPICSLFNHSCDPNVISVPTKENERIVYSKFTIEEGEQLFLCYVGDNYTSCSKEERAETIWSAYKFQCECRACQENWSQSLPFVKDILRKSPELKISLGTKYKYIEKLKGTIVNQLQGNNFEYDPKMISNLQKLMKEHETYLTRRSMDYETFERFIYMMIVNAFGTWLNINDSC